jgi:cytochrome P450
MGYPSSMMPPGPEESPLRQAFDYHRDPLRFLGRAQQQFGRVFTMRMTGKDPMVVVAVPEVLHELLLSDPERSRAGAARRQVLPQVSPRSPFGADGPTHRTVRARMAPAFAPERMRRLEPEIETLAAQHVATWPTGRPFRLLPRLRTLATDIFVHHMLGVDDAERRRRLVLAIRRMLWTPGNPPTPVPGPKNGRAGRAVTRMFERRLRAVAVPLSEELALRRSGKGDPGDLLGLLCDRRSATDHDIVDELAVVVAAAQEPPSIALTNVILELAHRGDLQDKFCDATPLERDSVVNEVLRLRPSAQAALRELTGPFKVDGYVLPAGTSVVLSSLLLHRDPVAFPAPNAFDPMRFVGVDEEQLPYLPFGGGARRCLAEPLGRTELRAVLPIVLRDRSFRPAWPTEERMRVRGTVLVPHRSALVSAQLRP